MFVCTPVQAGALCDLSTDLTASMGTQLHHQYRVCWADDIDSTDEQEDNLRIILPLATDILRRWNLRSGFTHVDLASTGEKDVTGNPLAGSEEWGKIITLGSRLCSKSDIQRGNQDIQLLMSIRKQGLRGSVWKVTSLVRGSGTVAAVV